MSIDNHVLLSILKRKKRTDTKKRISVYITYKDRWWLSCRFPNYTRYAPCNRDCGNKTHGPAKCLALSMLRRVLSHVLQSNCEHGAKSIKPWNFAFGTSILATLLYAYMHISRRCQTICHSIINSCHLLVRSPTFVCQVKFYVNKQS